MLKLSRFYIAVAIMALVLTGCGKKTEVKDETPAAENTQVTQEAVDNQEDKKTLIANGVDYLSVEGLELHPGASIAMVATNSENIFFDIVKSGAAKAVEDINLALGYTGKDKVKFSFAAAKGQDVIEQINIIDQFLDKAPDALCVAFTDASACKTQMDIAKNNGIKTIAFDTADNSGLTDTIVATNNQAAARAAAQKMFEAIDYEGKVAILVHNSLTQTGQVRKQAIIDEMAENYNDKNIQFVEIVYTAQEERSETEILSDLLDDYEDLAGIICTDLKTTEMVINYAKKAGGLDQKVVGFDTSEKIISEIGGVLTGTMGQDPYSMGYATVVAAARAAAGMKNPEFVESAHVWIDALNLQSEEVQSVLNY